MGVLATINVKALAAYERLAARIKKLGGDPGAMLCALPESDVAADCDADPAEHRRAGQARGSGGDRRRRPAAGHASLSSSRARAVADRGDGEHFPPRMDRRLFPARP